MVDRKRPPIVVWIIPLLVGFAGFYRVTQSPNFEMYRAVDIVQLLGCGVCFGAVMVGVIFMLRGARS
jgi:predicted metal-binding protein